MVEHTSFRWLLLARCISLSLSIHSEDPSIHQVIHLPILSSINTSIHTKRPSNQDHDTTIFPSTGGDLSCYEQYASSRSYAAAMLLRHYNYRAIFTIDIPRIKCC